MTSRVYLKCKLCGAVTLLRYQVGYGDTQIVLPCGSCHCELRGFCTQNDEEALFSFQFENADIIPSGEEPDFVGQYSRELLSEKVKPYSMEVSLSLTPFMATSGYFREHQKNGRLQGAMHFADDLLPKSNDIFDLITLWENGKLSITAKKLDDLMPSPPLAHPNHLQVSMKLHPAIVAFLSPLMPEKWFERNELFPLLTSLIKNQPTQIVVCAAYFESNGYLAKCEKSLYAEIKRFVAIVPNILPAFAMCDSIVAQEIMENRGMYSISFEDLKSYYQNSYEVIANCSDCLIALNGINYRKDFSALAKPVGEIKTIYDLEKCRSKINKVEKFLSPNESFSGLIAEPLHSHIRNAIGHNDVSYDTLSQVIVFEDKHNGKTVREEKYLVEFAKICIDNFCTCVYLMEIVYQLRKIAFSNNGDVPDAGHMRYYLQLAHKKVGRNEPCPCGSGKKFKHCCGR